MTETPINGTFEDSTSPDGGYTPFQAALIGISAGLLSLVTIAGNFMVMVSFKMDKQLQTISNYFLFSLAVADMIIGSISMPLFTAYVIQQEWTFGSVVCDSWLSVDYLASNASVLNLLVISFDRYFSVTRPLTYRARRTTKKAALMIFSAWAISAIVWPPWIIAWPYIEGERTVPENDCYIQFIYSNEYMSIVTVMIAFFWPVSVMIWLYLRVWWETVKRQRELVHLQAGKNITSSKRSDSSDETAGEIVDSSSRFGGRWKIGGGGGGSGSQTPGQGGCKEDLTYMPTSMFRSRISALSLTASAREQSSFMSRLSEYVAACCSGIRESAVSDDGGSSVGTRGGSQRGFMGGVGPAGGGSSEGYTTPRSLETPVQTGSSLAQIRDPYASRIPPMLRQSDSKQQQQQQQQLQASNTATDTESIYTIVIQFPSSSSSTGSSSKHESSDRKQQRSRSPNTRKQKSKSDEFPPKRVPSIKMLPEDATARLAGIRSLQGLTDDYDDDLDPAVLAAAAAASSSSVQHPHHYPRSLPIVRRFEAQPSASTMVDVASAATRRTLSRSANQSASGSPTSKGSYQPAKQASWRGSDGCSTHVSSQILPASSTTPSAGPTGSSQVAPATSLLSVASSGFKRPLVMTTAATKVKKATSEKKQDRKAAKTLSAILLAFIVTWTPYSVLVVINAILGKEAADKYIPNVVWQFSYYLCYINSTVNPVLYALCNAAFRRTYVRILTCRWGSRARQPVNRYYYG